MDKKLKRNRQKVPEREELLDLTPRGASFDTAEGRAAQGMKPDIGPRSEAHPERNDLPPSAADVAPPQGG